MSVETEAEPLTTLEKSCVVDMAERIFIGFWSASGEDEIDDGYLARNCLKAAETFLAEAKKWSEAQK